ncbi:hypothetical protein CL684_02190 [Candidatus Campbellbacteria bacterium]|nr:hypothetical protein [Candidatus Campbellbacteria bacterium]|tara:strand:+ start:1873 stop:2874 length:1002 start_codon:yes stop_codon:yes gene_type:complete
MNIRKNIFSITLALFALLGFSASTQALTVSPAILEVDGDPGVILSGEVTLFNETDIEQTYYVSFENFEPSDDTGTPNFIGAESGLATWYTTGDAITLQAKERVLFPYSISIPTDVEAGGYFAAMFFGTEPPQDDGNIAIGGRIGILTLLRVNGDIPESGGIIGYGTKDDQFFYDVPPVEFAYRMSNDGGDRVVPRGIIEITNIFGATVAEVDVNEVKGNVLPGSARKFAPVWTAGYTDDALSFFGKVRAQLENFHFGYYTADAEISWGFTNQSSSESTSFIIIPWQLLILLFFGLALLSIIISTSGTAYKNKVLRDFEEMKRREEEDNQETEE